MLDRNTREIIKRVTEEIKQEDKKRRELLNTNIDYNFLQVLMNKCNENPDLVVTIYFKSGDKMTLQTKYKDTSIGRFAYDGEPAVNELEVR